MRRATYRTCAPAAAVLLALLAAAGCRPRGTERYVPTEPAARRALEAALRAWQEGSADPNINTVSPPVVVSDSVRRPGQRLVRFEVLGEVPGDGPRQFAVRLR